MLRVLQEGEFERLGSSKTIHVDVRLIAATSRNLEAAVREGKFREDLYYRLNVFPIRVPPLRERRKDIPMLTWHFLRELGGRMGRDVEAVRATTMKAFQGYSWPGNVRELRNVIERNLITHPGRIFDAELPEGNCATASAGTTIEEVERNHISRELERSSWRVRGLGRRSRDAGVETHHPGSSNEEARNCQEIESDATLLSQKLDYSGGLEISERGRREEAAFSGTFASTVSPLLLLDMKWIFSGSRDQRSYRFWQQVRKIEQLQPFPADTPSLYELVASVAMPVICGTCGGPLRSRFKRLFRTLRLKRWYSVYGRDQRYLLYRYLACSMYF